MTWFKNSKNNAGMCMKKSLLGQKAGMSLKSKKLCSENHPKNMIDWNKAGMYMKKRLLMLKIRHIIENTRLM